MRSDIVERIKSAVSSTTKKAVKISSDAIDYTKLKLKIAEVNAKLDDKYAQIGLAVYEGNDEEDIEIICDEIKALRQEIDEYKLKLSEFKNQKACPHCQTVCDKEDIFCKGCGEKLN